MTINYSELQYLRHQHLENGVLLLTIDRPSVMNATNARLHYELTHIWKVVAEDPGVRVAVITGRGNSAFSAGGDMDWLGGIVGNPSAARAVIDEGGDLVRNMLACEKPVIAAINGIAVGAGLAVALLSDISLISESAKLTDGHVRLGVAAGDHAAMLWPLLCGMAKAKYYLLTADFIDGREAERIGLVSRCVPDESLMQTALQIANKLAKGSQVGIRDTKTALNGWMKLAGPIFDHSLALELAGFLSEDAGEGIRALQEKRTPQFPSAT